MIEYSQLLVERRRSRNAASRIRPLVLILAPLAAVLFQVYVPLFFNYLGYLELPLLVTVYLTLMRRNPIAGTLYGAAIGLMQDSVSHRPLGMFGIVKTLVGYIAGSISVRFDVDHSVVRLVLAFAFYFFHQLVYWTLDRTLLGATVEFSVEQTLFLGIMNAAVSVPLFHVLDKLNARA